jgi:hypothetical protein
MVGYVNLTLEPGFSLVANPLSATDNSVPALFANAPDDTTVFKFDPSSGGYQFMTKIGGAWEGVPVLSLEPGEGAFVSVPEGDPATITFVGEVVLESNVQIPEGFSIASSVIPQEGALSSDLEFPLVDDLTVFEFNRATGGYDPATVVGGAWEPAEPNISVGEAFFVSSPSDTSWPRSFSVGP